MRAAVFRIVSGGQLESAAKQTRPASRERQAKTNAALRRGVGASSSPKGLEDGSQVSTIDARTGVDNVQMQLGFFIVQTHEHRRVLRAASVPTGVVDQHRGDAIDQIDIRSHRSAVLDGVFHSR